MVAVGAQVALGTVVRHGLAVAQFVTFCLTHAVRDITAIYGV